MKKIFLILLFCCALKASLRSEVESITIRWTTILCESNCIKLLEREFRKIKGIDQISIDPGSGQATLIWKPNIPFQYTSVNYAMRMVGLSIRNIRIRVKGKITHSGERFYITSEGDYTRFELLNPIISDPRGVTAEFNETARKIAPALKWQLLEGERAKQMATVEGPVFMPERNTIPTQIVVDQLNFSEPAQVE